MLIIICVWVGVAVQGSNSSRRFLVMALSYRHTYVRSNVHTSYIQTSGQTFVSAIDFIWILTRTAWETYRNRMPKQKNGRYALFSSSLLLLLFQRNDGICCNFIWTDVWSGCFCPLFCLLCVRQTPSHKTRTNGLSFSQLYEGNIVLLSWCRVGCGILFQLCRLLCLPHLLIRTCILYFYHLIPLGCFGRYWNSWFFHLKRSGWFIFILF